jgi:hypothetical protein
MAGDSGTPVVREKKRSFYISSYYHCKCCLPASVHIQSTFASLFATVQKLSLPTDTKYEADSAQLLFPLQRA